MKKWLLATLFVVTLALSACGVPEAMWKIENKVADRDPSKVTFRNPQSVEVSLNGTATVIDANGETSDLPAGTWSVTSNFPLKAGNAQIIYAEWLGESLLIQKDGGGTERISGGIVIQP